MAKRRSTTANSATEAVYEVLCQVLHSGPVSGLLIPASSQQTATFTADLAEFAKSLKGIIEPYFRDDPLLAGVALEQVQWVVLAERIMESDMEYMDSLVL